MFFKLVSGPLHQMLIWKMQNHLLCGCKTCAEKIYLCHAKSFFIPGKKTHLFSNGVSIYGHQMFSRFGKSKTNFLELCFRKNDLFKSNSVFEIARRTFNFSSVSLEKSNFNVILQRKVFSETSFTGLLVERFIVSKSHFRESPNFEIFSWIEFRVADKSFGCWLAKKNFNFVLLFPALPDICLIVFIKRF